MLAGKYDHACADAGPMHQIEHIHLYCRKCNLALRILDSDYIIGELIALEPHVRYAYQINTQPFHTIKN